MFTVEQFIDNERTVDGQAAVHIINSREVGNGGFDPGLRRPYLDEDGKIYVDVTNGWKDRQDKEGQLILNSSGNRISDRVLKPQLVTERMAQGLPVLHVDNATTLTKDQWIRMDTAVLKSARQRLRAWADLRAANTFGGFDGMTVPLLEHEIMTDPGEAIADMEGLAEGRNFAPKFQLQGLPLPITHSDFYLAQRFLAVSRTKGQPQDMLRAEIAGRRVAELIEKTLIGTVAGTVYGPNTSTYLRDAKVYGYITHPARTTKTDLQTSANMKTNIATTGGGLFLTDVLEMIDDQASNNFYGPFVLYISTAYDALLDFDFKAESDKTIRSRVREVDQITDIRRLDFLTGDVMILVQMTDDVAQAVNGLELTTVQWDTKGGMQMNFKVMAIQVPRIRSVFKSGGTTEVCGVLHATTT